MFTLRFRAISTAIGIEDLVGHLPKELKKITISHIFNQTNNMNRAIRFFLREKFRRFEKFDAYCYRWRHARCDCSNAEIPQPTGAGARNPEKELRPRSSSEQGRGKCSKILQESGIVRSAERIL